MELTACTERPQGLVHTLLMPILFYLICLPSSSGSQGSEVSQTTTLLSPLNYPSPGVAWEWCGLGLGRPQPQALSPNRTPTSGQRSPPM